MKKTIITMLLILTTILTSVSCGADAKDGGMEGMNDGINIMPDNQGVLSDEDILSDAEDGYDSDDYGKFIENKFISTETQNVSTFSADVDTASYTYFRKLVNSGYSLKELSATAGRSIRTEEMINYFDYGYAEPENDELFSAEMQIAPCPWNKDAQLMILGLQAKKIEISSKNNLVFLIDVSGSMNSDDKLGLLKTSFAHLTDKLGEDDVISIVTYSGSEKTVLDGAEGSKKEMILDAVSSLEAQGSTNGEAGLKKAYELAEKHFIPDGNNRIIMASDGDLNVGMSSVSELESYVEQKRESGVFLSVLGFGTGNYKDEKMETIADKGNGIYYYIDSEAEAEKVFGEKIFSTLYTIAKDVKLQLTFDKDIISEYRLVGYENRLLKEEDFRDDTKDGGELGVGHSITVCYELILTDKAEQTETPWMTLGIRHKAPDGEKSEESEYSFGKEVFTLSPAGDFKFICSLVEMSMLLHDSEYAKDITLDSILSLLEEAELDDDDKLQFKELTELLKDNSKKDK